MVTIRRATADEWEVARELRLAALADAPDAFAATLEEERTMAPDRWQARARSNAAGRDSVAFFGCDEGGTPRGMVVGVLRSGPPAAVELSALWVAPAFRQSGMGGRLVEAVVSWARERAAECVELEVTHTSGGAKRLYEDLGFQTLERVEEGCGARAAPAVRMRMGLCR